MSTAQTPTSESDGAEVMRPHPAPCRFPKSPDCTCP